MRFRSGFVENVSDISVRVCNSVVAVVISNNNNKKKHVVLEKFAIGKKS
jgi:hypothetical protein